MREIIRLVLVLGLICAFTASALTGVRIALEPRIEQQSDFYVRGPALSNLFAKPAEELLQNKVILSTEEGEVPVFYLKDVSGEITGLAIEAPGHGGYGGDIMLMVGVDLAKDKVLGMEIIQHSETPGLGARVDEAAFRNQFKGLEVAVPAKLKSVGGSIDAISGATHSSHAAVDGANRILGIVQNHRSKIMELIGARG